MRVAIIHPWFPQYRGKFFESLVDRAADEGIQVDIFYGQAPPEWRARNDTLSSPRFHELPTRFFTIRGRTLSLKSLAAVRARGPYNLIIVEQAVRNLETFRLLSRRRSTPVAFWGHGRTYTVKVSAAHEWLKQWLTQRGSWFFSYTAGGARAVTQAGFPRTRVTVVQNSIDTASLHDAIVNVNAGIVAAFQRKHDLRGKTALFIGGLDEPKRIPFLLKAAQLVHDSNPDFRLLVAGDGDQHEFVQLAAQSVNWLKYIGATHGNNKTIALAASEVLAMPGRVGLVAVDSFAAGIPIVTTLWPLHAPEFEYLEDGKNAVVTPDNHAEYANGLASLLNDSGRRQELSAACLMAATRYTVEAMVKNFLSGIVRALS